MKNYVFEKIRRICDQIKKTFLRDDENVDKMWKSDKKSEILEKKSMFMKQLYYP